MNIGSCVDPNPLRVERQNPDNFPRLQTRERCALEIAAYVFKTNGYETKIRKDDCNNNNDFYSDKNEIKEKCV